MSLQVVFYHHENDITPARMRSNKPEAQARDVPSLALRACDHLSREGNNRKARAKRKGAKS